MKNKYFNDNNNIKLLDNMHIRPKSSLKCKIILDNSNNNIKKHGNHNSSEKISKKEMNLRRENKEINEVKKEEKIKNNIIEKSNEKEIEFLNQLIEKILSIIKKKKNQINISELKELIDKLYKYDLNINFPLLKKNLNYLELNYFLNEKEFNEKKNYIIKQIQNFRIYINTLYENKK